MNSTRDEEFAERQEETSRSFYVRAPSVNAVRRALHRAPGGVRVIGRQDRESILCTHTMDVHSMTRHWPVIVSRLEKAGLAIVSRPGPDSSTGKAPGLEQPARD
jgi:hypothetical protein